MFSIQEINFLNCGPNQSLMHFKVLEKLFNKKVYRNRFEKKSIWSKSSCLAVLFRILYPVFLV